MEPPIAESGAARPRVILWDVVDALSNYPVWYRWIEERLGLSRYLSWSFLSCDMGMRKPEHGIFERAARSLQLAPAECLLIDDRASNCDAAREVGMLAVQQRGDAQRLWADLQRLGVDAA